LTKPFNFIPKDRYFKIAAVPEAGCKALSTDYGAQFGVGEVAN